MNPYAAYVKGVVSCFFVYLWSPPFMPRQGSAPLPRFLAATRKLLPRKYFEKCQNSWNNGFNTNVVWCTSLLSPYKRADTLYIIRHTWCTDVVLQNGTIWYDLLRLISGRISIISAEHHPLVHVLCDLQSGPCIRCRGSTDTKRWRTLSEGNLEVRTCHWLKSSQLRL